MPEESTIVRWSAYEHEHVERGADWYWALGIVAVSIAITSILLRDFFFALLILIAAVVFALVARRPPELANFELSERGLSINDKLYSYDEILAFWVEESDGNKPYLLIDTPKWLAPNVVIPIEQIEPDIIRAYLKEYVEERFMREPFTHKVVEFLGL